MIVVMCYTCVTHVLHMCYTYTCAESDAECPGCGLTYLDDDTHSVWVACDTCEIWCDFKCTGLKNPKKYICPDCKPLSHNTSIVS